ncbi:MAG: Unknown protein [uncultured Sulfurovum sp.]|uniref:Uncharacterized protein n=1 Tax=uncultured Sulfurovum sp. TaxID=269237 RepID=A0A6S6TW77_9BACT|nr:MAG: Unknown protein [uncultured Sulfurovum sp.]
MIKNKLKKEKFVMYKFIKKVLLLVFFSCNIYASDLNQSVIQTQKTIVVIQKKLDTLIKENKGLKIEVERLNDKREASNDRIDDLGNSLEHFGNYLDKSDTVISSVIGMFGIFMTVLVIIITFRSYKEAKLAAKEEAEKEIDKWIDNEAKDFMNSKIDRVQSEIYEDTGNKVELLLKKYEVKIEKLQREMEQLQKKSNNEVKVLKEELEERGNEVLDNLSSKIMENDVFDTEFSIEDKQYFEYQIKGIKSKSLNKRTIQDYKKIILFYIASKEYKLALSLVQKLLDKDKYSGSERGALYYLEGLIADKQNLFDKAISSFNQVIEYLPESPLGYTAKAKIYNVEKQNYKKAIELATKALELDEYNYEAYISLGYATRNKAYFENKVELYKKAIVYNKKAIEINPDLELAYNNIGSIFLMQQKYEDAKKWYYHSLEISKNEWLYVNLFRIFLISNEQFPLEFEKEYLALEKKNSEEFSKYRMLKILQNIANSKYKSKEEIEEEINEWKNIHKELRHYFFGALEEWMNKETDSFKKENIEYALQLFETHKIK